MTRYSDLYQHVNSSPCPDVVFEDIKLRYREKISSNRQLASCRSITDILYILEKRDEINEKNYDILEELYVLLRDRKSQVPKPKERELRENGTKPEVRVLPVLPDNLYERLQQIISLKIGHKWKDFARGLQITEGQIDELEDRHKNVSDRVRDILTYHEHLCSEQFRYSSIFNALCRARRKDLALEVQYIIDTH